MRDGEMDAHPDLDLLIDDLPASAVSRAAVLAHVARCSRCEAELSAAIRLREMARALPRECAPGRDLWPGIAARVDSRGAAREVPRARSVWGPGPWVARAVAIAAGIVALVGAGTIGYLLGDGESVPPVAVSVPPTRVATPAALAAFASIEADYRSTVESLEAELQQRRATLSPQTIAAVEENLDIIDRAIEEAWIALARDPSSADLPLLLAGVYRQKVEVLSDVLALSARS